MDRETPRLTITLPADILGRVREQAGPRGVSAWIAEAAADRLARQALRAEIADYEAEFGAITDAEIAAARDRTRWAPGDRADSSAA